MKKREGRSERRGIRKGREFIGRSKITREDIIYLFSEKVETPLSLTDIKHSMGISSGKVLSSVKAILDAMVRNGELIMTRGEKYAYPGKLNLIQGTMVFKKNGYAFVTDETGGGNDIFVKSNDAGEAIPGDTVILRIVPDTPYYRRKKEKKDGSAKKGAEVGSRGRRGKVVRIIRRSLKTFKALVKLEKTIAVLSPLTPEFEDKFFSDLHKFKERDKLVNGTIVTADISDAPDFSSRMAKIVDILGGIESPGTEERIILSKYALFESFGEEALRELENIPGDAEEISAGGRPGLTDECRTDLTALPFVTIDGEDAKDFDDAVYLDKPVLSDSYRLIVAIADVSHFVKTGSKIDSEAFKRGNSTYFPGKVYPMLPEKLSNNLCSLLPQKTRFVMVCEMDISKTGKILDARIYKGLIKTFGRLTYNEVFSFLSGTADEETGEKLSPIRDMLLKMKKLSEILRNRRMKAGGLDFDSLYGKVVLGEEGEVKEIIPEPRNFAHRLIEDFMITANCAVAQFIEGKKMPSVYRVHEKPDEDRVKDFLSILKYFKFTFSEHFLDKPKDYQKMLETLKKSEVSVFLEQAFLRSMKVAVYSPVNIHHFGLALKSYSHFTSPIRRYADLVVHRILKWIIYEEDASSAHMPSKPARAKVPEPVPGSVHASEPPSWLNTDSLKTVCNYISRREKMSSDAEREYVDFKKMQFLKQNEQKTYDGYITGVLNFGFFVDLTGFFTQGFVHVSTIADDYYEYNEKSRILKGRHSKKVFKIGDRVLVSVYSIDLLKREIDLRFIKFYESV